MSGGLVIQRPATWNNHCHDQRASDPEMSTASAISRQSRQVSGDQQRLNKQETQRNNPPANPADDIDSIAPFEKLACRGKRDRHADGGDQRTAQIRLLRAHVIYCIT